MDSSSVIMVILGVVFGVIFGFMGFKFYMTILNKKILLNAKKTIKNQNLYFKVEGETINLAQELSRLEEERLRELEETKKTKKSWWRLWKA